MSYSEQHLAETLEIVKLISAGTIESIVQLLKKVN